MTDLRNPFRLRAANRLERDDTFVSLFAPRILSIIDDAAFAGPPHVFRSAPGGGKTSLLRLFTPAALWAAQRRKEIDSDLFQSLLGVGAVDSSQPQLLAFMLAIGRDIATLDDLPLEAATRRRLFFAMITAKIAIEAIRSASQLSSQEPLTLDRIQCLGPATETTASPVAFPCSGQELFDWASEQEIAIGRALDTFPLPTTFPGQESLSIVRALSANQIHVDGKPIAQRTLIMFDDLQNLAAHQRQSLIEDVATERYTVPIWMTERLAALDEQQLLDVGARPDRDFSTLVLEDEWVERRAVYRQALSDIATRRANMSTVVTIPEFAPCLDDQIAPQTDKGAYQDQSAHWVRWLEDRRNGTDVLATTIVNDVLGPDAPLDDWETLVKIRSVAILIERERAKSQSTFDFATDAAIDADVRGAAELFLCKEGRLPYYFGFDRLAMLSSGNIEQFLGVSGDMFERLAAKTLSRKNANLTASEQDSLVRAASERKLAELPQYVARATQVRTLLLSIGNACAERTFLANAPYSPGVTGVGLRLREWQRLLPHSSQDVVGIARLRTVLHSASSNNLIEISRPQRCKGDEWVIVRLNRVLCPVFWLPLQRSQWRPTTIRELVGWMEREYSPKQSRIEGL